MPQRNKELRPTVIGPPGASLRKAPNPRTPRVDAPAPPASSIPAAPLLRQPTAIPGTERKRIDVPPGKLERLSPGASAEVYERGRAMIRAFVVDKASERKAILWGHDGQKEYSELVTEALTLSRSPVLRKVEGYLARTMEILESMDLLAACGHGSRGIVGRVIQRVNAKVDTPGELDRAQAELEKLVALMSAALQDLLDLKDRLLRVAERIDATGAQLEASAIAALFLAECLRNENGAVAQRFVERAMSLTQTLALIREGGATRSFHLQQPIRLVAAIQDIALVLLPGFIGSMASIAALSTRKAAVTPTEAGELAYRLADLVEKLKSSTQ